MDYVAGGEWFTGETEAISPGNGWIFLFSCAVQGPWKKALKYGFINSLAFYCHISPTLTKIIIMTAMQGRRASPSRSHQSMRLGSWPCWRPTSSQASEQGKKELVHNSTERNSQNRHLARWPRCPLECPYPASECWFQSQCCSQGQLQPHCSPLPSFL